MLITNKLFTPSSADLNNMIERAMQKCDGDIEQSNLRKEARAGQRMEKIMVAESVARSRIRRWGF